VIILLFRQDILKKNLQPVNYNVTAYNGPFNIAFQRRGGYVGKFR